MGRKRTSGVSHNKNSKTYESSNRSVPSDSQTQSIKNFFTVSRREQEDEEPTVSHFTLLYGECLLLILYEKERVET